MRMTGRTFYGPATGQAHVGLEAWRRLRPKLGRIVEVRMEDYRQHPFPLTLRDDRGNVVKLAGFTSGYYGTGPKATVQLLAEAGFTAEWVQALAYGARSWRLTRRQYCREQARRMGLEVLD